MRTAFIGLLFVLVIVDAPQGQAAHKPHHNCAIVTGQQPPSWEDPRVLYGKNKRYNRCVPIRNEPRMLCDRKGEFAWEVIETPKSWERGVDWIDKASNAKRLKGERFYLNDYHNPNREITSARRFTPPPPFPIPPGGLPNTYRCDLKRGETLQFVEHPDFDANFCVIGGSVGLDERPKWISDRRHRLIRNFDRRRTRIFFRTRIAMPDIEGTARCRGMRYMACANRAGGGWVCTTPKFFNPEIIGGGDYEFDVLPAGAIFGGHAAWAACTKEGNCLETLQRIYEAVKATGRSPVSIAADLP